MGAVLTSFLLHSKRVLHYVRLIGRICFFTQWLILLLFKLDIVSNKGKK